jgi:4-methyl-5(b-hydroxyethyl)-thiazole monophosphate biosynthesis
MESNIQGAVLTHAPVTVDKNIITSQGVGTAIEFALTLIEVLVGSGKSKEIAESIVYRQ